MTNMDKKNLVNVFSDYSEFTTTFTIKHCSCNDFDTDAVKPVTILEAWAPIIKKALEMRMESCMSMLFRNRNNVILANPHTVIFKKNNGMLHQFNVLSFKIMEETIAHIDAGDMEWLLYEPFACDQIAKSIYWISEEDRKDRNNISFGNLISTLHERMIYNSSIENMD